MDIIDHTEGCGSAPGLTQDRLKQLLVYDAETGTFRWRHSKGGRIAGTTAGAISAFGYLRIRIDGRRYPAHCLAWLYVHGSFAKGEIDHRDCVRTNNAINNLRPATRSQNVANAKVSRKNKSGFKGVSYRPDMHRYRAVIKTGRKQIHLGYFITAEAAHAAYAIAAVEVFGDFGRAA